jgi:hypothetical protein
MDAAFGAATRQVLVVAVVVAFTTAMGRVGLGTLARPLFVAAGIAVAAYYIRRSPWLYLTATLWFWTLTPLARRLVDFHAGFDATSLMLATPNAMALLMARDILSSPALHGQREARAGVLLLLPVLYGLGVSLVGGEVLPAAVAVAEWIGPLLYYFYLLAHWQKIDEAEPHIRAFLTLNMAVVVPYGLYQYVAPTAWDIAWVLDSGMASIGSPVPYGLRVFGTLNAPGILAIWLGTLLLLALHFRTRLATVLLPAAAILLMLTMVRSVAGSVMLGLASVMLLGPAGLLRSTLRSLLLLTLVVATVTSIVFALDPDTAERVSARFGTVGELESDDSALERRALYAAAPAMIDAHPLGMGIGALGRGAVTGNGKLVTVDAGPLAVYLALGWFAGSLFLVSTLAILLQSFAAARASRSLAALVLSAAMLANLSGLLFFNVFAGFPGALTWLCAGYAAALGVHARQASAAGEPRTHHVPAGPGPGLRPARQRSAAG